MENIQHPKRFVALLRGINVGGHHKVPMAELKKGMANLGFSKISTLLNSGNVVFEADTEEIEALETTIEKHLQQVFGFPIPILLRDAKEISDIVRLDPFKSINITKDTRLYVSFLKQKPVVDFTLPLISDDHSYQILDIQDRTIFSVLDISITKTPKGMDLLEKKFGKEITTRNWNTISKITQIP